MRCWCAGVDAFTGLADVSPSELPVKFVVDSFAKGMRPFVDQLCIVTGAAGDGKSSFIDASMCDAGVDASATLVVHEHPLYRSE